MIKNLNAIISAPLEQDIDRNIISDANDIKKLFLSDYSEAYKKYINNNKIFKGMRQEELFAFTSTTKNRISQNTSNVYTKLFSDILPSWQGWPKRNHSFICTSLYDLAEDYGKVYAVFPKNGTELAICPTADIWYSFIDSSIKHHTLESFNYEFMRMLSMLFNKSIIEIKNMFVTNDNNSLINMLTEAENAIRQYDKNKYEELIDDAAYIKNIIKYIISGKSMIDTLDFMFNPVISKFTKCKIANYNINPDDSYREIWFDNEALFINTVNSIESFDNWMMELL